MTRPSVLAVLSTALCISYLAQAQDTTESGRLLRGSRSIQIAYTINDFSGCRINIPDLSVGHKYQISLADGLRIAPPDMQSDLLSTLLIESTGGRDSGGTHICAYYLNLRVIHPIYGNLRYRSAPGLLQVLVYNKSIFGVGRPETLESVAVQYSGKLVQMLIDEHTAGNRSFGTLNQ